MTRKKNKRQFGKSISYQLFLALLFCGILSTELIFAQTCVSQIGVCEGETITATKTGGDIGAADHNTIYYLVNEGTTTIVAAQDTDGPAAFASAALGCYQVHVLVYDETDAPTAAADLTSITDLASITDGCYNDNLLTDFICACVNPSNEGCVGDPFIINSGGSTTGNDQLYVLTTSAGVIVNTILDPDISNPTDVDFAPVAAGDYLVYAINYDPNNVPSFFPLTNGGTLLDQAAVDAATGCFNTGFLADFMCYTINPTIVPSASGDTYCEGDIIADVTATGNGGNFTWYGDAALTTPVSGSVSGTNNETWTPSGLVGTENAWVTQTLLDCESEAVMLSVTIEPSLPALVASGEANYCEGETINVVTVSEMAGTTVNWYEDAALTIPTTGVVGSTWTPPTTIGVHTLYVTQSLSACTSMPTTVSVEVKGVPSIVATSTDPTTCNGADGTINLTFTNVPDGTHTIDYSGGTFSVNVTGGMGSIGNLSAGTYDALSITVNGCSSSEVLNFVLTDPSVTNPVAASASYCAGQIIVPVTANGTTDAIFNWYLDAALTMPVSNISGAANETWTPQQAIGVQTVYVTQTDFNCISEATEVIIELLICDGDEFEAINNFMASDPCSCNNDQTLNVSGDGDGTFSEVVTIEGPQNVLVQVQDGNQSGMMGPVFPAMLTETAVGSGVYQITFNHADGVGYSISEFEFSIDDGDTWQPVTDPDLGGAIIQISNRCIYPEVVVSSETIDFCVEGVVVNLSDASLGLSEVNNNPGNYTFDLGAGATTTFDPSTGVGNYPLSITYTGIDDGFGGVSPNGGTTPAYPGCIASTNMLINVEECPADNYGIGRVCAGNALYVTDADLEAVLPIVTNAVYTWYSLDGAGNWVAVATVNGVPYYSPQTPGTYSVSMGLSSGCDCFPVGNISMTVDEIINCDNCEN